MNKIAKFEKVSYKQFEKDVQNIIKETGMILPSNLQEVYEAIELPKRATKGSAGYDFKIPFSLLCYKNNSYVIPTGIRAKMENGWVLKLYPRSGLGTKRGLKLLNTVGIIDSDYYNSDNEGHIIAKITHTEGGYILNLNSGQGFIQGIFLPFGITEDDVANEDRNGGFGSTGN